MHWASQRYVSSQQTLNTELGENNIVAGWMTYVHNLVVVEVMLGLHERSINEIYFIA
jgi:hypothetical protein